MKFIPTFRCKNIQVVLDFYTSVLGFEVTFNHSTDDNQFHYAGIRLGENEIHLSTHSGDGPLGSVVYVLVNEVDELFASFTKRGLDQSDRKESPVHLGPINQTWGMREFYVTDPEGNTLRFGCPC